jgi:hypothetical protein
LVIAVILLGWSGAHISPAPATESKHFARCNCKYCVDRVTVVNLIRETLAGISRPQLHDHIAIDVMRPASSFAPCLRPPGIGASR